MGISKRTALLSAGIITFGLCTLFIGLHFKNSQPPKDPNSWDILIFTQTWPKTLCYSWKSENANHTCNFPLEKNLWTVHGIWPTKIGTESPSFCNKSIHFDPDAIYGIRKDLHEYWCDIEVAPNNTGNLYNSNNVTSHEKKSIWFHEWIKHGSCAITLPALNSEFKYFYQGIDWSKNYNMRDILDKSNIKVNSESKYVSDYWKVLKKYLKTNAWVECYFKKDTNQQMLAEIRICFDKNLKLIDCDGIVLSQQRTRNNHPLTNCNMNKPILYLDYVPEHNTTNTTISNSVNDNEWDVIVFSQTWPYTFCHTLNINSRTHACNLPVNHNQWTIHGLWPNKIGTSGPMYCDNQTSFSDSLDTIIPELHNRWTDLKGSKTMSSKQDELWKHEWKKHGTCFKSFPTLDGQLKYFKQGLDWSQKFSLSDLLMQGGIKPNGTYPVTQFWHTLKTGLGKIPWIKCFIEKNSNKAYIFEVHLCFNKTLTLIDCEIYGKRSDLPNTNCPLNQDINYLGTEF